MAYQMTCSQGDSFMVKSEDEDEVVEMTRQHAREKHDMDMSTDDAREMVEQT